MDLSWCIICDRHCTDNNNLYCSEACKFQDNTEGHSNTPPSPLFKTITLSPPSSPVVTHSLYSFQSSNSRRRSSASPFQFAPYSFSSTLSDSSLYDT
ncbi:hypothetical protein BD560DRAFT_407911 [Blakeslea trispora]|nr:hypothetical protein BD560DRAFT_407911 [Blakeslea trispora]